jgi:hypothetical protein
MSDDKKPDGGPAFPQSKESYRFQLGHDELTPAGMTLRDYFAAQALALFSLDERDMIRFARGERPQHEKTAEFCYSLADAMLKERNKGR